MRDLISRQAAIAEFSCCELTPDGGIDANYAIDFLTQMPSAQQWIPCSERLPETPDRVLVTIDWGDGDYEVSTDEYWSIDGVETEGWGDLHGEVVTAWMPLPEPYKGEQE